MGGPNWDENVEKICELEDEEICLHAEYMEVSTSGIGVGTKAPEHWAQMGWSARFQEFVDDWSLDNTQAPLYPIEDISQV